MPDNYDATYRTIQSGDLAWANYGGMLNRSVVKVGLKDPQWQKKVASLQDATLAYTRTDSISRITQPSVLWVWKSRNDFPPQNIVVSTLKGDPCSQVLYAALNSANTGNSASLRSLAKLDFLGKVREAESPFQAGVFFGELRETLRMIRHPLQGIVRTTKSYRNRVQRHLRVNRKVDQVSEVLGNAYLQWTYGVRPLLADIEGIATSVEHLYGVPKSVRLSVSKKDTIPVKPSSGSGFSYFESGRIAIWLQTMIQRSVNVRITGALKSQLAGPSIPHLAEEWSVRLSDFVPTVYELIPYSFLLDYFTNLGSALSGAFTSTRNLIYASESVKTELTGVTLAVPFPGVTGTHISSPPRSPAVGQQSRLTFNRYKADLSVSLRDLQFREPSVVQWFNTALLGLHRYRSV